jgi:WD40 repeat protein
MAAKNGSIPFIPCIFTFYWHFCTESAVAWLKPTDDQYAQGIRLVLNHPKQVTHVTWHKKGDYFASVSPQGTQFLFPYRLTSLRSFCAGDSASVLVHQLSKQRTQNPFKKSKGIVQKVVFHPSKPLFFVAVSHCFTPSCRITTHLLSPDQAACAHLRPHEARNGAQDHVWYQMDL